jgi:flap endonuclease-1
MGVNIRDLITPIKIDFEKLKNKIIAIDAYNSIYQFLSIIRQYDGKPLIDRRGFVTSHLSGIFYRTINLLENQVKPIYVFDGEPPILKSKTIEERKETRIKSRIKWEEALDRGELVEALRYAKASSKLTEGMVSESKKLISYMGIPIIQAPSEGEAQAAYMVLKGDVWASGSQDWDSLLFGATRLIRNLTISGRRKIPKKQVYIKIEPEIVNLEDVLKNINITRTQLIDIAILVGTDYNKGVKGVGAKTALKLIKKYGNLEKIIEKENIKLESDIQRIRDLFLNPKIERDYDFHWSELKSNDIFELLCNNHDFSYERVNKAIERLEEVEKDKKKPTLDNWLSKDN